MDEYLRFVKEKLSELAAIEMKLDADIKLAIIVNGLSETYRYLVVNLEQQEMVDFDELSARLLEEGQGRCLCHECEGGKADICSVEMSAGWDDSVMTLGRNTA